MTISNDVKEKIEDAIIKITAAKQVLQSYTYEAVRERAWQTIDEAVDELAELITAENEKKTVIKRHVKFVPKEGNIEGEKWIDKK